MSAITECAGVAGGVITYGTAERLTVTGRFPDNTYVILSTLTSTTTTVNARGAPAIGAAAGAGGW